MRNCTQTAHAGYRITATGVSEFVREESAVFFTALEDPQPVLLDPSKTRLFRDETSKFALSRLYLEATLRRTPLPQAERGLAMPDSFLLDALTYQQRPAELALKNLRPRILLADVVGLGKTLEIGLILAELIRRGRGDRILVVTPQQVLEQFQLELWTRFAIPLIRLDSVGIERIQREIPAGRNPFTYYKRIIISVDTLKNVGRFGQHLDNMHWDAVVIDESHNLIGSGSQNLRHRLAQRLAKRTDALLLASATPHNGDAESFAQLIKMLDPAAIADERNYEAKDIDHLYIRRTKISREVTNEIGGKWRERGPSVPLRCPASQAEEKVFAELTQTWLADPAQAPGAGTDRRLFPYTLLKTFLSSHKALAATARKRSKNSTDAREQAALERLAALADQVDRRRLCQAEQARRAPEGDRRRPAQRRPRRRLLRVGAHPRMAEQGHPCPSLASPRNGGSTRRTRRGRSSSCTPACPIPGSRRSSSASPSPTPWSASCSPRDVLSEGVNMQAQCHHLIHYDLPWSLIRIEQRNGRIDRYGQVHQPQFAALVLTSATDGAKDDTTVAEKLLKREETAHSQLGTAEGVTRQFTSAKEEDRLVKDLLAGKTVEQSIDELAGTDPGLDFLADLLGGVGDQPADTAPERARLPRLFASTEQFARAALTEAASGLHVDDDGELLAFAPPDDLIQRLSVLPASYLRLHKVDERMKVTFSKRLAQRKLDEARTTKTWWPDIAYLSDLHPMIDWLTDKVLLRVPRQQAPVLLAKVDEPAFLIEGVYSNALGQPTVVEWMAVTGLPGSPRIADMTDALTAAGIGPSLVNTRQFGDIAALERLVPAAVDAAREHLEACRAEYDAKVNGPIEEYRARLGTWEQLSLDFLQAQQRGKREQVSETAKELRRLTDALRTAGEPLLRVLAVLSPDEESAR